MPGLIKLPLFWGYLDDRGVITVKKYVTDWDIQKVEQLPFCKGIFEPIGCVDAVDAHQKFSERLQLEEMHDKRQQ